VALIKQVAKFEAVRHAQGSEFVVEFPNSAKDIG
jgi:hypothetical protein